MTEVEHRKLARVRQALHDHARVHQHGTTPLDWILFAARRPEVRAAYRGREELLTRELRAVAALVWGTWR